MRRASSSPPRSGAVLRGMLRPASTPRAPRAPGACSTRSPRSPACGRRCASRARRRWRSSSPGRTAEGDRATRSQLRTRTSAGLVVDWAADRARRCWPRRPDGDRSRGRSRCGFHNTLAEMIVAVAQRVGGARVVLTGGCFQNRYLTERDDRRGCARRASLPIGTSASRRTTAASRSGRSVGGGARTSRRKREERMCLAVPGRIVSLIGRRSGFAARPVDFGGIVKEVNLAFVPEAERRRLRARPRRLRHHHHRRGRGPEGLRATSRRSASWSGAERPESREVPRRVPRRRAAARRFARAPRAAITTRPWTLMEVCGGQTHAIVRFGLDELLPPEVDARPRAGLPGLRDAARADRQGDRDRRAARASSSAPSATCCACRAATGDLLAVKAEGGDVRIVYSPLDALAVARANPGRARSSSSPSASRPRRRPTPWPSTRPSARGIAELLAARLARPGAAGDARPSSRSPEQPRAGLPRRRPRLHRHGLRGVRARSPREYRVPIVVTGFEPLDILQGVYLCVRQLEEGRAEVENQYARAVRREGNLPAQQLHARGVPASCRGAGAASARSPRAASGSPTAYASFDAEPRFGVVGAVAGRESGGVHQRPGPARREEAARVPRLRHALHARASARRADGLVGRRLRRLLPLPRASRAAGGGSR